MDDFVGYHGLETPIARSLIKLPQLPTQLHPLVVPSFGQSFLGSQAKRRFLVVSWSSQIPAGQPLRLVKDSSGGHENVNSWSRKGSLGFCIFRHTMPGGELEFCSCKWPFSGWVPAKEHREENHIQKVGVGRDTGPKASDRHSTRDSFKTTGQKPRFIINMNMLCTICVRVILL